LELPGRGSSNITGVGKGVGVGGLNSLAGGLGQRVLNISASNLGDGVAVLNLNGDNLDLGVVNAVLGGDLTASVLHSGDSRVGHGVSDRSNVGNGSGNSVSKGSGGITSSITIVSISIGLGVSLSLDNMTVSGGCVTEGVYDILADLLVLNLLGLNNLGGAHVLSGGSTGLCNKDLLLNNTVGGGSMVGNGSNRGGNNRCSSQRSSSQMGASVQELGVSLGVSVSSWGGVSGHGEEKDGDKLVHDEIVLHFPR
jgi:hypothetical protein